MDVWQLIGINLLAIVQVIILATLVYATIKFAAYVSIYLQAKAILSILLALCTTAVLLLFCVGIFCIEYGEFLWLKGMGVTIIAIPLIWFGSRIFIEDDK